MAAILTALYVVGTLVPEQQESAAIKQQKDELAALSFPDFEGTTTDGSTFRLSEHKGKVILVNFWGTWCGPCRMEIPDLISLQKKYGPRGFVIVGLASERDPDPEAALDGVRSFAKEFGINYPLLLVPEGTPDKFGGVDSFPTTFLIDRSGKVVRKIAGISPEIKPEEMWEKEIKKVL